MRLDWVDISLWGLMLVLVIIFIVGVVSNNKDQCNVPENALTKDYLLCKKKLADDSADVAVISSTIMLAGASAQ